MNPITISECAECTQLSLQSKITFPEVIKRLAKVRIERYYTDLVRMEKTYYSKDGETHVEKLVLDSAPAISGDFNEQGVKATLKSIQKGEMGYPEFLKRIMDNGTISYTVFIDGACTVYTGRKGEEYIERFPATVIN